MCILPIVLLYPPEQVIVKRQKILIPPNMIGKLKIPIKRLRTLFLTFNGRKDHPSVLNVSKIDFPYSFPESAVFIVCFILFFHKAHTNILIS